MQLYDPFFAGRELSISDARKASGGRSADGDGSRLTDDDFVDSFGDTNVGPAETPLVLTEEAPPHEPAETPHPTDDHVEGHSVDAHVQPDGADGAHVEGDHLTPDGSGHTEASHGSADPTTNPSGASLVQNPDLGDCFVVSVLNTVAASEGGADYINSLVHDNGDGTYTVTLHTRSGQPYDVTVAPPTTNHGATPVGTDAQTAQNMAIVEEAIGVSRNSSGRFQSPGDINDYESIADGGLATRVYADLGMTDTHSTWRSNADATPYAVVDSYQNGGNVVVGTHGDDLHAPAVEAAGLIPGHSYSVSGVSTDPESGATLVTLHDPYGHDVTVPASTLDKNVLVDVSWGRVPGSEAPPNAYGPGERPGPQVIDTPSADLGAPVATDSAESDSSYVYSYGDDGAAQDSWVGGGGGGYV